MSGNKQIISIVVPFFNEEIIIEDFYQNIVQVINNLQNYVFEIVCINDGSLDNTLNKLLHLAEHDPRFRIIDLSRNFGKEAALTAGIDEAVGDAVIPFDADLQDPPGLIPKLLEKWEDGYEVVLARRSERSTDSFLKRTSAEIFYWLNNTISDIHIPENVGDFRLMDRIVVEAMRQLPERQRFMKGLFSWVGFKIVTVDYVRQHRTGGSTKFSVWKLWKLAAEGITSFSTTPLRIWTYIGFSISLLSLSYALFIVLRTLILGIDVPGYASLITAILFIGGIQLMSIGILGEYIGRIYSESKNRPIYIVRSRFSKNTDLHPK